MLSDAGEDVGRPRLRIDVVHLAVTMMLLHGSGSLSAAIEADRITPTFGLRQSRSHSAHIGQDVVIQYRWHPLYGRSVRRIQGERRASCDFVHVELSPGAVTIRKHPVKLSITHNFGSDSGSQRDVGQAQ